MSNLFVSLKKGWGGREGRGKEGNKFDTPKPQSWLLYVDSPRVESKSCFKGEGGRGRGGRGGRRERERGGEWKESTKGESILSSRDRSFVLSASFQSFVVYHNLLIAKNGFHHVIHCSQWKVERSSALVDRRRDRTWNICFPVV